jgi:hypothetical protein
MFVYPQVSKESKRRTERKKIDVIFQAINRRPILYAICALYYYTRIGVQKGKKKKEK